MDGPGRKRHLAAGAIFGALVFAGFLAGAPRLPVEEGIESTPATAATPAATPAGTAGTLAEATPTPARAERATPDATVGAPSAVVAAGADIVALETQHGSASYYANSLAGRRTASGVRYDPRALVAAHRTLPFGTVVRVENLSNGSIVILEVVDRGPFAKGRVLDVSRRAAEELGFVREGHTRVRIDVLEYGAGPGT